MKRIFIALPISRNLQDTALAFQKNYPTLSVRWLAGKNLHITLIPPWYTDDIESLKSKLDSIGKIFSPFTLNFERVSFGPNPHQPRLIWAEAKAPESLTKFKTELENSLNIRTEKRKFFPHLTLARFRPENFQKFPIKNLDEKINWPPELITSFVLMQSRLFSSGADYKILEEVKFRILS